MSEPAREPLLCDLCRIFEADAMTMEGQALCARCANSMNPQRDFTTTRGRARWWWKEYRQAEALPFYWVLARFVQFETPDTPPVTGSVWLGLLLTGIFLLGMTVR